MALVYKDRVKETWTGTGTGTPITLAGAATGFRSFTSALANGDLVTYCIEDGTNWEVGEGVFTTSGTTLARTTIIASSNAGAAVSFPAGTKNVFLVLSARDVHPTTNIAADTLWDAAGDLAVGSGADTASKLSKGSNNTFLGTGSGTVGWQDVLSSSSNRVGAAVTMTTAGTYYDGPTLTIGAGTYLLVGGITMVAVSTASRTFNAKLWDGTTLSMIAMYTVPGTAVASRLTLPLSAIVAPTGSTTYKISATSTVNGDSINGTVAGSGDSWLIALKIA